MNSAAAITHGQFNTFMESFGKELKESIRDIIRKETEPLNNQVAEIKEQVNHMSKAYVTDARTGIMQLNTGNFPIEKTQKYLREAMLDVIFDAIGALDEKKNESKPLATLVEYQGKESLEDFEKEMERRVETLVHFLQEGKDGAGKINEDSYKHTVDSLIDKLDTNFGVGEMVITNKVDDLDEAQDRKEDTINQLKDRLIYYRKSLYKGASPSNFFQS